MRIKPKFHLVDPFGFYYAFIPNEATWTYEMRRIGGDAPLQGYECGGDAKTVLFRSRYFDNLSGDLALVVLPEADLQNPLGIAGVLIHEAVHIFQFALESVGEENVGDETMAYGIQRISMDLLEDFRRTRL
jgi:hypothetical protein